MNDIVIQKLDRKIRDKAQLLYFSGKDVTEVASILSIEPDTLRFYVFGVDGEGQEKNCWYQIKKNLKPTAITVFLKDKAHVFEDSAGVALQILNHSLTNLRDAIINGDHEPLSIDDMTKMSKIVGDMDKLYRLEAGLATEKIEHMGLSRTQAKEILANDPFASDVIEADFSSLPWLKDEEVAVED